MAKSVNAKERSAQSTLTEFERNNIKDLRGRLEQDHGNATTWRHKQIVAVNQRLGVKRLTDEPYPGAPDIPLPETDKIIKKSIPGKVLSAWSPKKLALVELEDGHELTPQVKAQVKKAEKLLNSHLRSKDVGWFNKLMLAADNEEQYGHALFRVLETFKNRLVAKTIDLDDDFTEEQVIQFKALSADEKRAEVAKRFTLDLEDDKEVLDDVLKQFNAGERVIKFNKEVIKSFPDISIDLPTKITVPDYTTDMESAIRIRREEFWTRVDLEKMMESGAFIEKDLEKLNIGASVPNADDEINETNKAFNEGVTNSSGAEDLYKLEIINTWHKREEGDPWQRWIFVFLAAVGDPEEALLQSIPFPMPFDGWDYTKHDHEIKDPRYYDSRSTPEQVRAYQDIMERAMKNILVRDEIANCPMYEVLDTSEIMDAHVNFKPAAKLPVQQLHTEIAPVNQGQTVDVQSERIITMLKAFVEEYVSSNDQLFRNDTNAGGGKTKGEVQIGVQENQAPKQLTIIHWHESLSKVYQKYFELMRDRMVDSVVIDGETITADDLQFPAKITSNGSIEMGEAQFASQKAWNRVGAVGQFMQAGIANLDDFYQAAVEWLERDGVRSPDQFTTDPKVIMQEKISQMQQMLQQMQQQAEQGQEVISQQQKTIKRNQTKFDKDVDQFQGEMEGISENGPQEG